MRCGGAPSTKLGLALQIGFLRMSGRVLDSVRMVPAALWRHLGEQFAVAAPDLASLRAMYRRGNTLFEHQQLACEVLGFHWMSEAQRRALIRALRAEFARTTDRLRLVAFARSWLYEHRLIIVFERKLRSMIAVAVRQFEDALARTIRANIDANNLDDWQVAILQPHDSGSTIQSWLWSAPAKHSTRQIEEVLDRIKWLCGVEIDRHLSDIPDALLRRYAGALARGHPRLVRASRSRRAPLRSLAFCATACSFALIVCC